MKTPVLLIVFNRLETTLLMIQKLRNVQPREIFIYCDGPRSHIAGEADRVRTVRQRIKEDIDWNCEIHLNFQVENLGCKIAVSSAITWFFQNVDAGIILEDDCLPKPEFFEFCENGLERFRYDPKIGAIGGFVATRVGRPFLSVHGSIWGWATWKNRWDEYNLDARIDRSDIEFLSQNQPIASIYHQYEVADRIDTHDTWDYQWLFTRIKNRWFTVLPGTPLVENIGFGDANSSHTNVDAPKVFAELAKHSVVPEDIDLTQLREANVKLLEVRRFINRHGIIRYARLTIKGLLLKKIKYK